MLAWIHSRYESIIMMTTIIGLMGVFYSTALTTIAIVIIAFAGCSHFSPDRLRSLFTDRMLIPLTLVFLVVLISGLYSHDTSSWMTAVRVKLPFLILPFGYFFGPPLSKRLVIQLHYWLVLISVIVGLPVFFLVVRDLDNAIDLISKGQSVETPIEHVKYSMTVAYAAITAWILYRHDERRLTNMRWMLLVAGGFLTLLLHVTAVRTGLGIFYVSLLVLSVFYLLKKTDRVIGIIMMIGIVLIPIVSIQVVPTLKQKVGYMLYDWNQYEQGKGELYSDSERILSYKAALSVIKGSPVAGVGYGDVRTSVRQYYMEVANRPELEKLPHSQYLTYLSGVGIIGFLIWLFGFYRPLFAFMRKDFGKDICFYLTLFLYLNYSLSFFVENSLDRSMSVAFFLLLLLPILRLSPFGGR